MISNTFITIDVEQRKRLLNNSQQLIASRIPYNGEKMPPYIDCISTLIYEQRFNFNREVAKSIIDSLESTGFTFTDFLRGASVLLDERRQLEAAKCLQRAAEALNQINQIKE